MFGSASRGISSILRDVKGQMLNLLPAVEAKGRATHPHLYDRLIAAGVTPDFPRPAPAGSMAWHGIVFSAALGMLAMGLIARLTGQLSAGQPAADLVGEPQRRGGAEY